MPKISNRGKTVPFSPFRKLMPFADKAKAIGRQVYHLNIGQPDISTPPYAIRKLQQAPLDIIAYSPGVGQFKLREAIADSKERSGLAIDPEQIIITSGASEAMYFILLSCLSPGDNIIIPEPFYANYNGFAHMTGAVVRPITSTIDNHFALPAIDQFEKAIDERTKAILITNPNNPTGCVYTKSDLKALAELIKKHDLFLIADEVYADFCFSEESFYSALQLKGLEDHVIVMDSVSKKYSACGARIGCIYSKNQALFHSIERLAKLRLSPPALSELLTLYMLEDDSAYMESVIKEYDLRRQTVYRRLSKIDGVSCYLPQGAFYCFAKFPIEDAEHFCQWLLEEFDHNGETVMLSPGSGFYATDGLGKDEVRIAFVLNQKKLEKAMDCLETGLDQYQSIHANRELDFV